MATADEQIPVALTDPPADEEPQVNGKPEAEQTEEQAEVQPKGDEQPPSEATPAEGSEPADTQENGEKPEEAEVTPQEEPKEPDTAAKAKEDAKKEKERKQADEERKKQEKLKEKEAEKERKQQEKEAKDAARRLAKEEKARKKQSKKVANVQVVLLDGAKHSFTVPRKCKASAIFDEVYKHLDMSETDFFGLYYMDGSMRVYIDPLKTAKRQIPADEDGVWQVTFGVKYYIEDPSVFKEDITRYQYVLQLCQDIKEQRVQVTQEQLDELLCFLIQSSVGDYDPTDHTDGYIADFVKFLYAKPDSLAEDYEAKIREVHKTKSGMNPEECEVAFLGIVKDLSRYGIHTYTAQDSRQTQVIIGISFRGFSIYHEAKEIHKFDWSVIVRVGFSKKKFKIWFDPSLEKPESVKPSLLELTMHNQGAAKRLWVICAEQHTFFRRKAPVAPPKTSRFNFSFKRGSKFRYSGRTLQQLQSVEAREKQPEFTRTYSERFHRPKVVVPKVQRSASFTEDPGASQVVTAEVQPNKDLDEEQQAEVVRTFLQKESEKVEDEPPVEEPVEEPSEEAKTEALPEPDEVAEPQTETVTDPPTETGLPEEQPQDPSPVLGEEEGKIEFGDPDDDEEQVKEDAKALVDDILEDASKIVGNDD